MGGLPEYPDNKDAKRIVLQSIQKVTEELTIDELLREEKTRTIAHAINSLAHEGKPDNLFICGNSGTGKTTVVKCLLSRLEGNGRVIPIYLNCHEYCTKMAFFSKISFRMGNPVPRRGFAFYEVFEHIKKMLKKEGKRLLLVLDDFDALGPSQAFEILHPIVETNENGCDSIGIFVIGVDFRFFEQLDTKVKSSLMFRIIEFEPYSKDELKSLLQVVAKRTLLEDSCDSEVLGKVAELGASNEGNARFAIWLLFSAAKDAEGRNSGKIELDDVAKAYERLVPVRAQNQNETGLCEEELLILDLLKEGEKESSEIYEIVQKRINRSKRQIRNYLSSLAQKGHIEGQEFEGTNSMLKPKLYRVCQRRLNEIYD